MVDFRSERTIVDFRGKVEFNGKCKIGAGSRIMVATTGRLVFHNNFSNPSHLSIICFKNIEFGNNNHFSWHTLVMDSDQHAIVDFNGRRVNADTPILLSDNVWCGCHVTILKGTKLCNNVIVGAGSIVHGQHLTPYVVIAGNPAQIVKTGVSRE